MLERHLRIGDALTTDELVEKSNMDGGVSMVRGDPHLKFVRVNDPIEGLPLKHIILNPKQLII